MKKVSKKATNYMTNSNYLKPMVTKRLIIIMTQNLMTAKTVDYNNDTKLDDLPTVG